MRATLVDRTALTDVITSFSFKPAGEFTYTAGQFIELTLLGHQENGLAAKRWFSLSGSPNEELLTITTRVGTATHTPYKRALDNLKMGALVDISEPMGDFVLPRLIQTPLIFVAGGIGITPFHSILKWLTETGEERTIRMLYGVRSEDDIIFQDTFTAAEQHVTVVVEEPSASWGGERGHLTAEMIIGLEKPSDETLIYLSGPEPFVQKLSGDLMAQGILRRQLVLDEFQGYDGI